MPSDDRGVIRSERSVARAGRLRTVNVRVALSSDAASFLSLAAEVEGWFGPMVDEPAFQDAVARAIDRGSALVAVSEDEVIGGLLFSHHRRPRFDIRWLVVAERWRGQRAGEMLVAGAFDRWVSVPATVEVVTFGADHPGARSRGFYSRLGFEPAEMVEQGPEGGSRQRFVLNLTAPPSWIA